MHREVLTCRVCQGRHYGESTMNSTSRLLLAAVCAALVWMGLGCERGADTATREPNAAAGAPARETADAPKLLEHLGDQHHPITTDNPLAQRYFDQGLILTFGFNHEAAVDSFEAATRLDPGCAMCFWGVALALGPNINAPMGPEAGRGAYAAAQEAVRLASRVSERERAYIAALAVRYAKEPPADRAELDRAYADAMRLVHQSDPNDVDAAVLFAEALMDLYPWNYWTDDAEPREYTEEIVTLLESALERNPDHVGANHYYIHAVEEHFPERGVAAAERLGTLAPDAGHLVHMPSHIFWRVGRYDDALEINRRAAAADEAFFSWCRAGPFYSAAYYPHNIHFLWAAASAEGRSAIALTAARKLEAKTASRVEEFPFLQEFMSIPTLTLVRFGRWDAVLGVDPPDPNHRYLVGIHHYARGMARTRTGELDAAQVELELLDAVLREPAAEALLVAGGTATARRLLGIGSAHLTGELALARGDTDTGLAALERAVTLQDALTYMEPPPWYFPTRQALGAALLEADRPADAETVYRADLAQYPRNGWSLYGLAESLQRQGRGDESSWAAAGHRNAWARADVTLAASRF
jgi:tetratricopeptide (TPR) repeat protein